MIEYSDIDLAGDYREPLIVLQSKQGKQRALYGAIAGFFLLSGLTFALLLYRYVSLELGILLALMTLVPGIWLITVALSYQVVTKPRIKRRLEFKIAEKCTWKGSQVLELEGVSQDDATRTFILDDGQGQLLYLSGDYLTELIEHKKFPSTEIELVWGPQRAFFIGLFIQGHPLALSSTIHYGELDLDGVWLPKSGDILVGSTKTFAADFKKHIDGY